MKIHKGLALTFFLLLLLTASGQYSSAWEIQNKHFRYRVSVPESTVAVPDTLSNGKGQLFYDSLTDVIFIITKADSRFRSVKDYLDCSRTQLENELKICYDDSTLHLVSCNNPKYYPDKTVLLHIEVSVLPGGYNESIIYFVHHKNKELQFSFMFRKSAGANAMNYIERVMTTLKLE